MSDQTIAKTGANSSRVDLTSLKILLFDPDRTSAGVTKLALQQAGLENFVYCTKRDIAQQLHRERPFDIALVDFTPSRFSPPHILSGNSAIQTCLTSHPGSRLFWVRRANKC